MEQATGRCEVCCFNFDNKVDVYTDAEVQAIKDGLGCPSCKDAAFPRGEELWECEGCKTTVMKFGEELDYRDGEQVHGWTGGFTYEFYPKHVWPPETEGIKCGGEVYCPGCVTTCPECRVEKIFTRGDLDPGDIYAEGTNLQHPTDMRCMGICLHCRLHLDEQHTLDGEINALSDEVDAAEDAYDDVTDRWVADITNDALMAERGGRESALEQLREQLVGKIKSYDRRDEQNEIDIQKKWNALQQEEVTE